MKKVLILTLLVVTLVASATVGFAAPKEKVMPNSQGAIVGDITIDYTAFLEENKGLVTLNYSRGRWSDTITTAIDWNLTNEEAIVFLQGWIEEELGLVAQGGFIFDYEFDEETYITTATFRLIHGKATKGLDTIQ